MIEPGMSLETFRTNKAMRGLDDKAGVYVISVTGIPEYNDRLKVGYCSGFAHRLSDVGTALTPIRPSVMIHRFYEKESNYTPRTGLMLRKGQRSNSTVARQAELRIHRLLDKMGITRIGEWFLVEDTDRPRFWQTLDECHYGREGGDTHDAPQGPRRSSDGSVKQPGRKAPLQYDVFLFTTNTYTIQEQHTFRYPLSVNNPRRNTKRGRSKVNKSVLHARAEQAVLDLRALARDRHDIARQKIEQKNRDRRRR